MMYGDSSFLIAVYRKGDAFHATAAKLLMQYRQPIALTLHGELELHNGVNRCLANGLVGLAEHNAIFRQIADDEADGILVRSAVADANLYAKAGDLSRRFTPTISSRSLDILHVAAALLLRTTTFITFDLKQRLLVQKVGIALLPRTLNPRKL